MLRTWGMYMCDRNWLLYFNGASIATWLPSFSLELHQPPPVNDFHHHIMNEEVSTYMYTMNHNMSNGCITVQPIDV